MMASVGLGWAVLPEHMAKDRELMLFWQSCRNNKQALITRNIEQYLTQNKSFRREATRLLLISIAGIKTGAGHASH